MARLLDRQEAAFIIMSVEQRELLMAVDDIAGESDGAGFATESYAGPKGSFLVGRVKPLSREFSVRPRREVPFAPIQFHKS